MGVSKATVEGLRKDLGEARRYNKILSVLLLVWVAVSCWAKYG